MIYVHGPLDRARWSINDDHEIVWFTGASDRLALIDIPRMLVVHTEVGHAAHVPRFRPGYHVLRLAETSLWGARPQRWYRARMAMYAVSVFLLGWVIATRIGVVATLGFLAWVLSAPYWFDVWRLGSAEAYGVLGFALWALGVHLLWPAAKPVGRAARWQQRVGLVLFVVGNAVVVTSKEPFVIIAVPNAVPDDPGDAGRTPRRRRWWACAVNVLTAVAMVIPLLVFFSRAPIDTYGRAVTAHARLAVLIPATLQLTAVHLAALAAALLWIAVRLRARWRSSVGPAGRELTSRLVLVSAAALGLYLSQVVLYNGEIIPHTRYEFPAALALPGLLVAVAVCLRRFFRATSSRRGERIVLWSTAAVFFGLTLLAAPGLGDQRTKNRAWARTTREFTAHITAAAATARVAPEVPDHRRERPAHRHGADRVGRAVSSRAGRRESPVPRPRLARAPLPVDTARGISRADH